MLRSGEKYTALGPRDVRRVDSSHQAGGGLPKSLDDLPCITMERRLSPALHDAAADLYREARIRMHAVSRADNVLGHFKLVQEGLGFALLADSISALLPPGVTFRRVAASVQDLAFGLPRNALPSARGVRAPLLACRRPRALEHRVFPSDGEVIRSFSVIFGRNGGTPYSSVATIGSASQRGRQLRRLASTAGVEA
jgi:hypothetical protein